MKIFKNILALAFAYVLCSGVQAQDDFASVSLRIRNPKDAMGIADTIGNVAYIFEGLKQYHISILDSNRKEIKNLIANRSVRKKKEELIGGTLSQDLFVAYFFSKKLGVFTSLTVQLNDNHYEFKELKKLSSNEQFLRSFTMNGKFYVLTVPRQKNILNVYSSADGSALNGGSYNIEMPTFYANLSANNERLNEPAESAVGIETVRTRLDNNIKSAYPKKKLYYENGMIYLSFDEPAVTHLVVVDVEAAKSDYKKLNFTLDQGNSSVAKKGNSFLYDQKIFRTTISENMMNISVIDLDSIKLINSYNIYPDKEIQILNGPIVQEGGSSSFALEERELGRTKQYFNRVMNGNISIAANRIDSGKVEVEVGSYEEIASARSMGGFGAPAFSLGFGMGFGGLGFGYPYSGFGSPFGYNPFYGYPGYYPYSNNGGTRLRIVSFKTLLKDPDFNHVAGQVPKTLREKINDFLQKRFRNNLPELYTVTSLNEEKLLLGYYLKNKNKFQIVQFARLDQPVN